MSVHLVIYELPAGGERRNLIDPVVLTPDPCMTDMAKAYAAMVKAGRKLEELENAVKQRAPHHAHKD